MIIKRFIGLYFTKLIVCLTGIIHAIFIYDGITTTIQDSVLFEENEELQNREKYEAFVLYTGHFLIIFLLFFSVYKNAVRYLLPWLFVMVWPLIYMTYMVLIGLRDMKPYLIDQLIENFILVGICWSIWSILFHIYRTGSFKILNFIDNTLIYYKRQKELY